MSTARLPFLVAVLILAACAARAGRIEPLRGVTEVTPTVAGWRVEVPGGIGRFRVVLPANASGELELVYADGRPFTRIEGIQVAGQTGDGHPAIVSDASGRLRISAGRAPLDLTVTAIDYYR